MKDGIEAIVGINLITNEKLSMKERLMSAFNAIPALKLVNKARKISKSLTFSNKAGKISRAAKASKNVGKKAEKKVEKKDGKKDKTNGKESVKDKEDGKIPDNYAREDANPHQALLDAKKYYDIPKGNQPTIKPNLDRRGKKQPGKIFEYEDINGKKVELRKDCDGHKFDDGPDLPPHFNGPDGKHFFYDVQKFKEKNLK